MSSVLNWVGAVILLVGVSFTLIAAIGVVRMPDIQTRMHGSSKPQMLGLLLVLLGVIVSTQDLKWIALGLVIVVLQFITAPVGTSMIAQAVEHTVRVKASMKKSGKYGRPSQLGQGSLAGKSGKAGKGVKATQSRKPGKTTKRGCASKTDRGVRLSKSGVPTKTTSMSTKKARTRTDP